MPFVVPSPSSKKHARIEIVPLIDIIFFLLATFVMVSLSMVKNKGVPVNLPVAPTAQPQERKDYASVSITAAGELYFNKTLVTPAELELQLKDFVAQNPDPRVFINGDTKAEFGLAITALDTLRRLGITKIAIETKNKAGVDGTPAAANAAPAPVGPATEVAPAVGSPEGSSLAAPPTGNPPAAAPPTAPAQPAGQP